MHSLVSTSVFQRWGRANYTDSSMLPGVRRVETRGMSQHMQTCREFNTGCLRGFRHYLMHGSPLSSALRKRREHMRALRAFSHTRRPELPHNGVSRRRAAPAARRGVWVTAALVEREVVEEAVRVLGVRPPGASRPSLQTD